MPARFKITSQQNCQTSFFAKLWCTMADLTSRVLAGAFKTVNYECMASFFSAQKQMNKDCSWILTKRDDNPKNLTQAVYVILKSTIFLYFKFNWKTTCSFLVSWKPTQCEKITFSFIFIPESTEQSGFWINFVCGGLCDVWPLSRGALVIAVGVGLRAQLLRTRFGGSRHQPVPRVSVVGAKNRRSKGKLMKNWYKTSS